MDVTKIRSDKAAEIQAGKTQATKKNPAAPQGPEAADSTPTQQIRSSTPERVNISADAALLSEGLKIAQDTPDVRADKVEAIKAQIKNGTYKVDAKAIADRMLQASYEEAGKA